MTPQLLLASDNPAYAETIHETLQAKGIRVDIVYSFNGAQEALHKNHPYQCLILDLGSLGLRICQRMRKKQDLTPTLVLFDQNSPHPISMGADMALRKPTSLNELSARIQVLLRRLSWDTQTASLGGAKIRFEKNQTLLNNIPLRLTDLESRLLYYFTQNPNRVIKRSEIIQAVWNSKKSEKMRTIDNFVMRLRRYFEPDPQNPIYFLSVRGSGYKFKPILHMD